MKFNAATLGMLLLLPFLALAQQTSTDDVVRQSWKDIQSGKDRQARAEWWRRIDVDELHAYLRSGVAVDITDHRGWMPLHSAARYNANADVIAVLIEAGATVNAKDRSGDTPLHWAAAENANVDVIATLLEAGADVSARDRFGWLPIHTAAETNSNPDVIEALLEAGSSRNKRAYFVFFRPKFLLKHNPNMSDADKERAMALLTKPD